MNGLDKFMYEKGIGFESTNCSGQIPKFLRKILEAIIEENKSNKERIDELEKRNKEFSGRINALENMNTKRKLMKIIKYLKGLIIAFIFLLN